MDPMRALSVSSCKDVTINAPCNPTYSHGPLTCPSRILVRNLGDLIMRRSLKGVL